MKSSLRNGNKIKNMLHNFELCSDLVPFHTLTHTHTQTEAVANAGRS